MKLIAEQIKELREKKKELLSRRDEYRSYLENGREMDTMEDGLVVFNDYVENEEYGRVLGEIHGIDETLETSEVVEDRNLDQVDIGTRFTVRFDDDEESKNFLLVDKDLGYVNGYSFVSLDSDFGKAALGMKEGDHTVYTVSANGNEIGMTIEQIDRVQGNYLQFLRKDQSELENQEVGIYTESQQELARESLSRGEGTPQYRQFLKRVVQAPAAKAPSDGTVGIGSRVTFVLLNPQTEEIVRNVEYIDHAISSELSCDYIEKTSPLGNAMFGLAQNNSFMLTDGIRGMVLSVENEKEMESERVR